MARPLKQGGFIYFLLAEKYDAVKIGFTRKCVGARLKECATWCPYDYDVLKIIKGTMAQERNFHKRFGQLRIRGEWFQYSEDLKTFIDKL